MKKTGVFVCHCGKNISATVNIEKVVEEIGKNQNVTVCKDYKYMCSEPGQNLLTETIKSDKLDRVVVACCTPSLHEETFRKAAESVGLNRYFLEIANIREQCSWVHSDMNKATPKAISIISSMIEKIKMNNSLEAIKVPVTQKALVIGGGIAGIQAALDIANSGYKVTLVEKNPSIGGHMAQLSETFPTLDCSQCILTPKMVDAGKHENIELLTYSEVENVSGTIGNFKVKIRRKAAYVDHDKCTGCGDCTDKCPTKVLSEFDEGLGKRKAIYSPFPQAVPNKPVIDSDNCLYFRFDGKCGICQKTCLLDAIDFNQEDKFIEDDFGAIVLATGYNTYPKENFREYGAGKYEDVITSLQFERMLSASGPTEGEILRPSDGKIPKRIAFLSCVGSRDPEHHMPYCSKICCMYNAKHAHLYKHQVPDGEAVVFNIDVRTAGKDYEEFFTRIKNSGNVLYIRGKPARVIKEKDKLVVWSYNTLTGRKFKLVCDMVVLATAIIPTANAVELANKLKIQTNENGFFSEIHPKLRPVESMVPGFLLAGCCHSPKDIPDTVAQASAAATKVLQMFSQPELSLDPQIAIVDEDVCSGCKMCIPVCPYEARVFNERKGIVEVREALCVGCGSCVTVCPSGATQQKNLQDLQISSMMEALLG